MWNFKCSKWIESFLILKLVSSFYVEYVRMKRTKCFVFFILFSGFLILGESIEISNDIMVNNLGYIFVQARPGTLNSPKVITKYRWNIVCLVCPIVFGSIVMFLPVINRVGKKVLQTVPKICQHVIISSSFTGHLNHNHELVGVITMFRHGDRGPLAVIINDTKPINCSSYVSDRYRVLENVVKKVDKKKKLAHSILPQRYIQL